jgi:hypothetical protein
MGLRGPFLPETSTARFNQWPIVEFCFHPALVLVEESKVVEARGDIRVVGAKRLLPDTQGVSEGFGSFLVITLLVELNTLLVECLSLFEGVRSRNGRIPNQYHGYGQKSQKACKAPKIAGKIL